MPGFIVRFVIAALALWLAAEIVSGIRVDSGTTLVIAALLLGVVNALVRPVLVILTLPITILTLGLFLLVINAAMLALVALFLPGFTIAGFWSAVLGGIILSLVGWIASWFIGPRGYVDIIVRRSRRYR
jgi:putative membrane protein